MMDRELRELIQAFLGLDLDSEGVGMQPEPHYARLGSSVKDGLVSTMSWALKLVGTDGESHTIARWIQPPSEGHGGYLWVSSSKRASPVLIMVFRMFHGVFVNLKRISPIVFMGRTELHAWDETSQANSVLGERMRMAFEHWVTREVPTFMDALTKRRGLKVVNGARAYDPEVDEQAMKARKHFRVVRDDDLDGLPRPRMWEF